ENNPQLLEVTTSSGVSIGSMGMQSRNYQQQQSSTSTTDNKILFKNNVSQKS
ncbi:unnamed protein product, partial [Rotaria magnacalcarata]